MIFANHWVAKKIKESFPSKAIVRFLFSVPTEAKYVILHPPFLILAIFLEIQAHRVSSIFVPFLKERGDILMPEDFHLCNTSYTSCIFLSFHIVATSSTAEPRIFFNAERMCSSERLQCGYKVLLLFNLR